MSQRTSAHHDWTGLTAPDFLGTDPVVVQVSGERACFSDPTFLSERISYPIMTPSAAVGVLSAIYWKPQFRWVVEKVEVLAPVKWDRIFRSELQRRVSLDSDAGRYTGDANVGTRRSTLFLRDVAYRIHTQPWVHPEADAREGLHLAQKHREILTRRVTKGQSFRDPCLGMREFIADVTAPDDTPAIDWTEDLGVMSHSIEYDRKGETYHWFDARVEDGVMTVPRNPIDLQAGAA